MTEHPLPDSPCAICHRPFRHHTPEQFTDCLTDDYLALRLKHERVLAILRAIPDDDDAAIRALRDELLGLL